MAVENQQQVGRHVGPRHRALADERRDQRVHLGHRGVLQEDQVEHDAVVERRRPLVDLRLNRQPRRVRQRHDAMDLPDRHHRESVDAQDHVEQRPQVEVFGLAPGVQVHAPAHARIEDVVDLQLPADGIDHFGERRVLKIQTSRCSTRRRRWRGGCRRRLILRRLGRRLGGLRGRSLRPWSLPGRNLRRFRRLRLLRRRGLGLRGNRHRLRRRNGRRRRKSGRDLRQHAGDRQQRRQHNT